jgi:ATP-dependent DNA ligase
MLCETKKQVANLVHEIINDGGEGVILRYPKSIFDQGRSNLLVKIKVPSLPLSLPFLKVW